MNMRLLVPLVALVAAGCGGDDDVRESAAQEGNGPQMVLSVALEPDPPVAGQPVTWMLTVRNDGSEATTLTYGSGQRGDVVLTNAGNEAYKWSAGRSFTQSVTEQEMAPGQEVEHRLEEQALSVAPGEYELVATLAAEPRVEPSRQQVQIR